MLTVFPGTAECLLGLVVQDLEASVTDCVKLSCLMPPNG